MVKETVSSITDEVITKIRKLAKEYECTIGNRAIYEATIDTISSIDFDSSTKQIFIVNEDFLSTVMYLDDSTLFDSSMKVEKVIDSMVKSYLYDKANEELNYLNY